MRQFPSSPGGPWLAGVVGVLGRPRPRQALPSYFLAISFRYQRRIVSGVTMPATCVKTRRPSAQLLPQNPILFTQIVDQIVLVAIHPASDGEDEELQSRGHGLRLLRRLGRHRPDLGRLNAPYGVPMVSARRPPRARFAPQRGSRTGYRPYRYFPRDTHTRRRHRPTSREGPSPSTVESRPSGR